ncbi:MAG: hypothetical protein DI556_22560 [Rhodovulum sulfidophilum]|uniref:Uncharacterized protein n=1 Tax=Rhodovulum sulfidophilum TaxID=35806 RepID=A0A2W5N441_RHOSU|nr:MAG: hypothetical protein DI556_22560 [Rhodovulum sulfidophilum]
MASELTKPDYGTGLMAFWAEIDDEYLMRYQQWHNCEHVPERVSTPGFRRGRRYRCVSGAPHFLMIYETESPATLASAPYLAKLDAPTPWTREALTHFRDPARGIYALVEAAGEEGAFCAAWLTALRFEPTAEVAPGDMRAWLAAMAARPGVGRVQLWRADLAASGIVTSERRIYGGAAAGDHLLLLIEAETPGDAEGAVLAAGDAAVPALAAREAEIVGRYWLELYHHSPELAGHAR